jgi:hypothetical protein
MKRISLVTIVSFLMLNMVQAQYPQSLPMTHTTFFAAEAMGADPVLEKDAYTSGATAEAIKANQWNLSQNSAARAGSSPVVEANTLSYSNYIDNNAGKAIVLSSANATRRSVYSLTSGNQYQYTDANPVEFYLGVLVNVSSVTSTNYVVSWDGSHTNNVVRGAVFVKADADGYNIGLSSVNNTTNVPAWSSKLNLNQTYFIVLKVKPKSDALTSYTFYVNPTIGSTEAESTPLSTSTVASGGLTQIRGINVQQATGINAKIAGLRFSGKWTDVVAAAGSVPVSTALPAPVVGAATNVAGKSFTANWTPVENATGYTVMVYTGTTFVDSTVVSGQATASVAVANLIPELTYTYKVRAKGNGSTYTNSVLSTASSAFTLLSASIPSNNLKIILKLDDLGVQNSVLACSHALDYMVANKIKFGMGAIAVRFDATAPGVLAPYMTAVNNQGHKLMEIWHHGYDHSQNNPTGTWEFRGRPYADQKASFENADQAIFNLLGVQMKSFGTPYNQSDAVTNTVFSENPNYKVFMFSSVKSTTNGITYVDNRVNMENGTGLAEYSYFVKNYNSSKANYTNYMTLQGHPNYYTAGSNNLEQFKLILKFLVSEGVEFVTPYEYYQSITTGIKNPSSNRDNTMNFTISPNPGKQNTTLSFELNETKDVTFSIYSVTGSLVKEMAHSGVGSGKNSFQLDVSDMQAGTYFCRLTDTENSAVQKLIVN